MEKLKILKLCMILFSMILINIQAQVIDDFSDGDFTKNPRWFGDSSIFEIYSNILHLNNYGFSSKSYLSTQSYAINNATWEFFVKLKFNPSSSNYCNVYLVSSNSDLKENTNGYFVKIGNTSDEISLYRQSGLEQTKIIDGRDDILDSDSVLVNVKVTRDSKGYWELFSDISLSGNFEKEGDCQDSSYIMSGYFGVLCKYSKTRGDKFFFDDIKVSGNAFRDSTPAKIIQYKLVSNNKIWIQFSETMNDTTVFDTNNYLVTSSNSCLYEIKKDTIQDNCYYLTLNENLTSGKSDNLRLFGIKDQFGNITDTLLPISYFKPSFNDVVINEIMADPFPGVNLPESEYLEIYNNSDFNIRLDNWKLICGTNEVTLPDTSIYSNNYIILCPKGFKNEFTEFVTTFDLLNSNGLTNSGSKVVLKDESGTTIDSISYSDNWYQNIEKGIGGWSLERVNPDDYCGIFDNWRASQNIHGGTPGRVNSVFNPMAFLEKPEIIKYELIHGHKITIEFSKQITNESLSKLSNYIVNSNIYATTVIIDNPYSRKISLLFNPPLPSDKELVFQLTELEDLCGNKFSTKLNFSYYKPQPFDVLINEIMIDPEPSVELPEYEYIELYNAAKRTIEIKNWLLKVGTNYYDIPDFKLYDEEFKLLTSSEIYNKVIDRDKIEIMNNFPSLNNSKGFIELTDHDTNTIHFLNYTDTWYRNNFKQEGGWSLELIDPGNPCGGKNNWTASNSKIGGTPGQINSVFGLNHDFSFPEIKRIGVIDSTTIIIFLNEPIKPNHDFNYSSFAIDHGIGNPVSIEIIPGEYNSIKLTVIKPFKQGIEYTLTINEQIENCIGISTVINAKHSFALPEQANYNDIVINEILFNPLFDGADFVEIYNTTNKIFDLKNLYIATKQIASSEIISSCKISDKSHLLFPGRYLVLSEKTEKIKEQYITKSSENFIEIHNMPDLPNKSGRVLILSKNATLIDEFEYNETMHFELLHDQKGVSLERINPTNETMNRYNWHSAAETAGYATPGYQNSHYSELNTEDKLFQINNEIFSPDNDGFEDMLEINYTNNQPGNICSIMIYDPKGRMIKTLADHVLLGSSEFFIWDGTNNLGQTAGIGIYIICINLYDLEGKIKNIKRTCVLAKRFN